MTAEEYLKVFHKDLLPIMDNGIKAGMINFAEAYHKERVNAISDKEINKNFPTDGKDIRSVYLWEENEKRVQGVKWFKEQLLKQ